MPVINNRKGGAVTLFAREKKGPARFFNDLSRARTLLEKSSPESASTTSARVIVRLLSV